MDEHMTPARLAMMPTLFRLTSLQRQPLSDKGYKMEATLFHEKASLGVSWTVGQPDTRLKQGLLVKPFSARWSARRDGSASPAWHPRKSRSATRISLILCHPNG